MTQTRPTCGTCPHAQMTQPRPRAGLAQESQVQKEYMTPPSKPNLDHSDRPRRQPYMAAQLQHECWRRHLPQPAPEPGWLLPVLTLLAVLSLTGWCAWCAYLAVDSWSWADLRDGLAAVWEAL